MTIYQALWVGGGAAIGAVFRWLLATLLNTPAWPYGTIAVNLLGCLVIGIVAALFRLSPSPEWLSLFLITGVLGGFTTFSSFSLESLGLMLGGSPFSAVAYVLTTVLGSLLACAAGYYAVLRLFG